MSSLLEHPIGSPRRLFRCVKTSMSLSIPHRRISTLKELGFHIMTLYAPVCLHSDPDGACAYGYGLAPHWRNLIGA